MLMEKAKRTWDTPVPKEEREAKERKLTVKREKLNKEKLLRSAQGYRAYWKIVLEQNQSIIDQIDLRIAALEDRQKKLLIEIQIAPDRLKSLESKVALLLRELNVPVDLDKKIVRAMKLHGQLARMTRELEGLQLEPEQLDLLKKAATLGLGEDRGV